MNNLYKELDESFSYHRDGFSLFGAYCSPDDSLKFFEFKNSAPVAFKSLLYRETKPILKSINLIDGFFSQERVPDSNSAIMLVLELLDRGQLEYIKLFDVDSVSPRVYVTKLVLDEKDNKEFMLRALEVLAQKYPEETIELDDFVIPTKEQTNKVKLKNGHNLLADTTDGKVDAGEQDFLTFSVDYDFDEKHKTLKSCFLDNKVPLSPDFAFMTVADVYGLLKKFND